MKAITLEEGRTRSLCSIFVEQGLMRATKEDLVELVFERLKDTQERVEREGITMEVPSFADIGKVLNSSIKEGLKNKTIEVDGEWVKLTQSGVRVGREWLAVLNEDRHR